MARVPTPPTPQDATADDLGPRPSDPIEALVWEYRHRVPNDFYGFLGLPPETPQAELLGECRTLMQRLNLAARSGQLPPDVAAMVAELLGGVTKVFGAFSDRKRKEAYDEALAAGSAARIEPQRDHLPPLDEPGSTGGSRSGGFWKKGR